MFTTHHISLETTRPSSRWHRYAQVHYRTIGKSEYEGKGRYQACCGGEKGSGVYHSSCHRVHHSTSSTGGPAKARGRLHFMAYPKDGCHMSFARLTFSLSISFIFLFFFFYWEVLDDEKGKQVTKWGSMKEWVQGEEYRACVPKDSETTSNRKSKCVCASAGPCV